MQRKVTCMLFDEALVGVSLSDRISVPTQRTMTDAGQMHVPCKFARTGSQLYTAGQLGLVDVDPKTVVTVFRDEADVFDEASMESFRSAPVTIGHPKDADGKSIAVSSENSKDLQVGVLEGMPARDEDTLGGVLVLTAQEAIDALEDGTKELSAGYICDIEDVGGKYFQRNIRANHIAIVAKGRAGSSCRISDEALELEDDSKVVIALLQDEAKVATKVTTQLTDELAVAVAATAKLTEDMEILTDSHTVAMDSLKVELSDAKTAATEGVIERCAVIENARLVADMRDLGSKSITEIERLVVEDQMPDRDLTSKSEAYISAMFEILVDASKGETPMGKLMGKQETHVVVDAKPQDPVHDARQKMIARQSAK